MTGAEPPALRVLRIYHSGVVGAWRERDRQLATAGARVTLVSARAWNEGGREIRLDVVPDGEDVWPIRTFGHHPNLFAYEPVGLWRALRSGDFDVIDLHEEPVSVAAAETQLLARLGGVKAPFCLYSAQNIEKRYPIPFRWLERIALRRAAAVHTCNEEAGAILRRKGFRGILCDLGLGVDIERFAPDDQVQHDVLRVGYVGRIEARKGVHVLVDAITKARGCTLEMLGEGPERSAVEAQVASADLADRVHVSGYATQAELPDRYRGFDVLAVPSLETPGWIEQFGRVAVEAMASGLPVVASRSGSLPEVVGDAGVLVPPGDVDALALALEQLANDPHERVRLGKLARARAEQYSWKTIATRQLGLYREMLASAG